MYVYRQPFPYNIFGTSKLRSWGPTKGPPIFPYLRLVKGSSLTITELDFNFTEMNLRKVGRTLNSITSATTITPTTVSSEYQVTALAVNATIAVPSGTPINGQSLIIRIRDDGNTRTLTWTVSAGGYRVIGVTLPTATTAQKLIYVGCIYNSADAFWDVLTVSNEN